MDWIQLAEDGVQQRQNLVSTTMKLRIPWGGGRSWVLLTR
jgi:hypothetical protein